MKNRDQNKSQVRELLQNHGLTGNIPPDIRSNISSSMDKNYRKIIKKTGGLTLAASIGGFIFFMLRRIETWLPAAKIVIPLALVSTASAVAIITQNLPAPRVEPTMLLRSFHSATLKDEMVEKTERLIMTGINGKPGELHVALSKTGTAQGTLPLIVGSLERAGTNIFITVKIIDPLTSKILFITETSAAGDKELPEATQKLAAQIHAFWASLTDTPHSGNR